MECEEDEKLYEISIHISVSINRMQRKVHVWLNLQTFVHIIEDIRTKKTLVYKVDVL